MEMHLRLCFIIFSIISVTFGAFAALPNKEYNIPLLFDVYENGIKMAPMTTEWDLSKGDTLHISNVEFSEKTFRFDIKRMNQALPLKEELKKKFDRELDWNEWVMTIQWPSPLFEEGLLEAINSSGRVLWQREIKKNEIESWETQIKTWKSRILKLDAYFDFSKNNFFQNNLVIRQINREHQPFWVLDEPIKFCMTHEVESGLKTRICSSYYEAINEEKELYFEPFTMASIQPRIIAFGENQKLKDEKAVALGQTIQFFAELSDGITFEYVAKPVRFNVVELVDSGDDQNLKLLAWGEKPNIPVNEYKKNMRGVLEKWLGRQWSQTIGDIREFWDVLIPKKKPILFVPGLGGGLFKVEFQFDKLPSEKNRPYLQSTTMDSTYSNSPVLRGKYQERTQLASSSNSLKIENINESIFQWEYAANKKGDFNHSTVTINDGKNLFKAYREIYRGYPGLVTLRAAGLVSSAGGLSIASEVELRYWFESLLGWSQYYLSKQRWGIDYKTFQTYTPIAFGSQSDNIKYNIFDLNYRLNPGVWGWDESWGISLSMAQMSYGNFQNQMLGAGFFVGRSMPVWFDEILNYIPFLRKPKWVNLEFNYYPVTQSSNVRLYDFGTGYGNWTFSAASKMMWTNRLFTEVGLGLRQVDFKQTTLSTVNRLQFTSLYGAISAGYYF